MGPLFERTYPWPADEDLEQHPRNGIEKTGLDNPFVIPDDGGLELPRDIIFTPNNELLVSDFANDEIKRYSMSGRFMDNIVTSDRNNDGIDSDCLNPPNTTIPIPGGIPDEFPYDVEVWCSSAGLDGPWGMAFKDNFLYV